MILSRCLTAGRATICRVPGARSRRRGARTARVQTVSHGNTWMRQRTDGGRLYAYDACTAPRAGDTVPAM